MYLDLCDCLARHFHEFKADAFRVRVVRMLVRMVVRGLVMHLIKHKTF